MKFEFKYANYILFSAFIMLCISCTEKETPGGVKYTVLKKGDSKEPGFGQFLVLDIDMKDSKDSVWYSSKKDGNPALLSVPDESMVNDAGEYGVFKELTKGDSVTFQLPAKTVFSKSRKGLPKNVDSLSLFSFNVALKDVWNQTQANEFSQQMMIKSEQKRAKSDSVTIARYLEERNITGALSTSSGLKYVVKKEGKGDLATKGNTAYVHYAGYLLDGTLFDTSLASVAKENNFNNGGSNEPYPVAVNTGRVIRGWDEMLQRMNKGMKVTVYVPSTLAYGVRGSDNIIPPYAILVFDMEVVDIK